MAIFFQRSFDGYKNSYRWQSWSCKLTVLDLIENVILRFSLDLSEVAVLLQGLGLGLSPGHGFEATQVVVTAVDGGPAGYLPLALGRL